ncbi:hypothetical protein FIBSPDRAFT_890861 [Athelia psychrophila]|uniref:Uncharacterized protein n=1 Tax=Athelia psychrophila TaxID=1759441 RepID=A0A166KFU3_9AGAM|nr:hypothetical protein FIBSPDRAFT_890861 [Fibularhizoctonia sp. CBS 109695]
MFGFTDSLPLREPVVQRKREQALEEATVTLLHRCSVFELLQAPPISCGYHCFFGTLLRIAPVKRASGAFEGVYAATNLQGVVKGPREDGVKGRLALAIALWSGRRAETASSTLQPYRRHSHALTRPPVVWFHAVTNYNHVDTLCKH